jgi:inorganic pyrophosphatase
MTIRGSKSTVAGLANPARLSAVDAQDKALTVVIIETPKGSRNKYAFDPVDRVFELKTVLPAGMTFPYDFGFVPSTRGGDGDPLDVLVLMDEAAFPGCRLSCRIIGVIEGEQGEKNKMERNDRIVADDLGRHFERDLEEFFVNYHRLSNQRFRILALKGPAAAKRCIKQARKRAH